MASLGMNFDPNAVEPGNFDDVPPGEYAAEVYDTEVKPTRSGSGKILAVQWRITEGPFENRRIFQNVNIANDSEAAQKIGQQQLKAICDAVGFTDHLDDSEIMHGWQCIIVVKMGKANGDYPAKPEVKNAKALNAAQPPQAKPQTQPKPSQAQPQRSAAPAQRTASPPKAAGPQGARPWGNRPAA